MLPPSNARSSGALIALGPLLVALVVMLQGAERVAGTPALLAGSLASGALSSAGGLLLTRHSRWARAAIGAGLAGFIFLTAAPLAGSPALALLFWTATLGVLSIAWGSSPRAIGGNAGGVRLAEAIGRLRAASYVALGTWFLVVAAGLASDPLSHAAVASSFALVLILAASWAKYEQTRRPVRVQLLAAAALLCLVSAAWSWGSWDRVLTIGSLIPAAALVFSRSRAPAAETGGGWDLVVAHPARLLVITFLGLSLAGTAALALPVSAASGERIDLIDAAFTAVSAVCVTGLIVLDTPVDFSRAGQLFILVLLQLGGLGIMAFSTAALGLFGHRLSLRYEGALAGLMSREDRGRLFQALHRLLLLTLVAEGLGAIFLTLLFAGEGDPLGRALGRGIFTAVSAFCNAGFALQSASLVPYQGNPWILHVVAGLIVLGGLSPLVVGSLPGWIRGRPTALESKLVITVTGALLVFGALVIGAVEWSNTLAGLSFWDRIHNAWFQSVTLRTAGFNTIEIAGVRPATFWLMIVWMFIGGSPGGTAGGIKTTTVALLVLAAASAVRGGEPTAFARRIPDRAVYRAAAVATIGALAVVSSLIALQLTQPLAHVTALFEVVSALGTVGLSLGGTTELDGVGKIIIMVSMFVGRVGPLTLFVFLAGRPAATSWKYPEEEVEVG